ncbi:hypothetical protein SELMODRAFT_134551 [Selaginella moellendorffii]|uniref:Pentacotripeptide-repeat region of PRORP domain-containing protein n=1 Tax=Selaginella moellendorffii TaxID=88036 RepID=D8T8S3_SELML|nr:hypothetical protein SELMODRAFT_134551 [Selaginella moellendorffii]
MALFPATSGILELEQAVEDLEQHQRDANPSTYALMLDWCVRLGALEAGKRIHRHSVECGMGKNRFVENLLINMYGKCGALEEARKILDRMEDSNVFSWTIMLAAYAQNGHLDDALECFWKMELEGVRANRVTIISALGCCKSFSRGQWFHSRIKQEGFLPDDVMIQNALVSLYGRCCEVDQARSVFDEICNKDLVSWTAMISAFVQNGHPDRAMVCFWSMQADGVKPCRVTFITILEAVMETRDARVCEEIHLQIIETGLEKDDKLLNLLVRSYGKCGDMEKMKESFEKLDEKNVVSWSGTIAAFSQNGYFWEAIRQLQKMDLEGVQANEVTFVSILDASVWEEIEEGEFLRSRIIESGYGSNVAVCNSLVNMYGKCHSLGNAKEVFWSMEERKNEISWSSLVAAYAQNNQATEAMKLFQHMDLEGLKPDRVTLISVLDACGDLRASKQSSQIHARVLEAGLERDVVVANALTALLNMYARCHSLEDARKVFAGMCRKDAICWNSLLAAYAQSGSGKEALQIFREMDLEGCKSMKPNDVTFVSTIDACANSMDLASGIVFHRRAAEVGMDSNVVVANSLIKMYGKCKRLEEAMSVFNRILGIRDLVSWNALISAFAQNGDGRRALETYWAMIREGVRPDRITFISVLDACATLGSIAEGREIHRQASEGGFESVDAVLGTLVNMYGRCGNAMEAELAFGKLQQRDAIAWNAVAAAITQTGDQRRALGILRGMDNEGVKPDNVTFITLLDTCADCNALVEGKIFHARAMELGFGFDIILGNALLNMYGKCGSLREANRVFAAMPVRNSVSWNTLIVAYAQNGHVKLAIGLFRDMDLEGIVPNQVSFLSIFFACSHAGMLEEGSKYFQYMVADHGLVPTPEHYGCFVDLLGRTGRLADAEELVTGMAEDARSLDWLILLGSSTLQENVEQAKRAVQHAVKLGSKQYWNF